MKKNAVTRLVSAAGISVVLVSPGFAVQIEGPYLNSNIGMTMQPTITYHATNNSANTGNQFLKVEPKGGIGFSTAYGYQTEDIRAEGELLYLKNKIKKSVMQSTNFNIMGAPDSGSTKVIALIANGLYDFDDESSFTPYVGIGLGFLRITQDVRSFPEISMAMINTTVITTITPDPITPTTTSVTTGNTTTTTTSPPTETVVTETQVVVAPVSILALPSGVTPITIDTSAKTDVPIPTPPDSSATTMSTSTVTGSSSATGSKLQFGYQAILGVSCKIGDYFKVSADYRYLRAMPTTFTVLDAGTPVPMKGSYSNHRVMVGLTAFF